MGSGVPGFLLDGLLVAVGIPPERAYFDSPPSFVATNPRSY